MRRREEKVKQAAPQINIKWKEINKLAQNWKELKNKTTRQSYLQLTVKTFKIK